MPLPGFQNPMPYFAAAVDRNEYTFLMQVLLSRSFVSLLQTLVYGVPLLLTGPQPHPTVLQSSGHNG